MDWLCLFGAGVLEMVWPVGFKYSKGFTNMAATVPTMLALLVSFGLLAKASKTLPIGTAYAIWTGMGVVGAAVFGIILFGESYSLVRIICISLIFAGIVGLKLTTTS
jgi:quaternary ammonium compound-resistance protein SugE